MNSHIENQYNDFENTMYNISMTSRFYSKIEHVKCYKKNNEPFLCNFIKNKNKKYIKYKKYKLNNNYLNNTEDEDTKKFIKLLNKKYSYKIFSKIIDYCLNKLKYDTNDIIHTFENINLSRQAYHIPQFLESIDSIYCEIDIDNKFNNIDELIRFLKNINFYVSIGGQRLFDEGPYFTLFDALIMNYDSFFFVKNKIILKIYDFHSILNGPTNTCYRYFFMQIYVFNNNDYEINKIINFNINIHGKKKTDNIKNVFVAFPYSKINFLVSPSHNYINSSEVVLSSNYTIKDEFLNNVTFYFNHNIHKHIKYIKISFEEYVNYKYQIISSFNIDINDLIINDFENNYIYTIPFTELENNKDIYSYPKKHIGYNFFNMEYSINFNFVFNDTIVTDHIKNIGANIQIIFIKRFTSVHRIIEDLYGVELSR